MSGKVKLVRDQAARWTRGAVRGVLCKDAHKMPAAVGSGGDENLTLM
jgi:hypothetical protein